MELPDCPPGAEGYQDTVTEMPKKPEKDDNECTKAEQEFQEHLNSLKVKVEDGTTRCMVERRGRDVSHNWIYLCYPCAAVCCGENILQTHISGKKHKTKLSMKSVWSPTIFDCHPYILKERGVIRTIAPLTKLNQKMAEEVYLHQTMETDMKFHRYKVNCHIQETLDKVQTPLLGTEYLVEHPPEPGNQEPSYLCTLCSKQGHQRTIVNHLTCYHHRCNYFARHFYKASKLLAPHRRRLNARIGVMTVVNRLAQRIEDKYGRLKPVNIDKDEFDRDKEAIIQWIFKGYHFSEDLGHTFEEVVDEELINSLTESTKEKMDERNPSPPVVAAPTRPQTSSNNERAASAGSLSDVSEEELQRDAQPYNKDKKPQDNNRGPPYSSRNVMKNTPDHNKVAKPYNRNYKMVLLREKKRLATEAAKETLAYHEKNPEKHPLYPEEWKKFWNKRYKEIQSEGKDPAKHDFKSEWIPFWTARMKELHDEELRINISELYRKMGVPLTESALSQVRESPEDARSSGRRSPTSKGRGHSHSRSPHRNRPLAPRRRSPIPRRRSPDLRRRSPIARRRTPDFRRRSPDSRRRSPDMKRRSPFPRRHSPEGFDSPPSPKRSTSYRQRSPTSFRRDRRSPMMRRRTPEHRSPGRSRSPYKRRGESPGVYSREGLRRNMSPLSQRAEHRNLSPSAHAARPPHAAHTAHTAHTAPSLQTVLISDEELRPDDGLSPWNSDNDIDSVDSVIDRRSHSASVSSRSSRIAHGGHAMRGGHGLHGGHGPHGPHGGHGARGGHVARPGPGPKPPAPQDFGPTDNVIATLRLLVALEDYLGSLGPKIVDLLTEALKMEKEKANSSEELLEREGVVALLETAKEKLKGAAQAGLVTGSAAAAVRAAVMRLAAALHEADKRHRETNDAQRKKGEGAVSVAGVGAVDRAEIAAQMAAALVAEGRTDVSPQELEQLIDAVVGMAEAKKRESEAKKKNQLTRNSTASGSRATSALQMLQSAYDDPNAPPFKDDASDAMDGLSDSDLETLLKNFNELSAEEQHSLIAYLKKLEVRAPQRVEKLRRFVGAAAAGAPSAVYELDAPFAPAAPSAPTDDNLVTIHSDDDDYTVEEVFKSATQKVKENQIQQEMAIVKKSLEESKTVEEPATTSVTVTNTLGISSAADLLALVHASIQSSALAKTAEVSHTAEVSTNNQPRSFGDMPESPANLEPIKQLSSLPSHVASDFQNQQSPSYQGRINSPHSQKSFGTNDSNENYNDNIQGQNNQSLMDMQSGVTNTQNMMQNRTYAGDMQPTTDSRQFSTNDNYQSPQSPFMSDRQPVQGNRPQLMSDRQTFQGGQSLLGEYRQTPMEEDRQQTMTNVRSQMVDNRQQSFSDNRQTLMNDNRQDDGRQFSMDNRQALQAGNRPQIQSLLGVNRPAPFGDNQTLVDNRQSAMSDNRWPAQTDNVQNEQMQTGYDNFNQNRPYNKRGRGNFKNNYNSQDTNQQHYNNYQKNSNTNFRGRSRGFQGGGRGRGFQGGGRGRGRGGM